MPVPSAVPPTSAPVSDAGPARPRPNPMGALRGATVLLSGRGAVAPATTRDAVLPAVRWDSPESMVGQVYLREGTLRGDIGHQPYTRSYVAATEGVLRFSHGSQAPASASLSAEELAAARGRTPGQALDAMARARGVATRFEEMASSKEFFDPNERDWWGMCAPWSWSSLHPTISKRVDVPGAEGQRGVWLAGEWISRADLGNWMMAVSRPFAMDATGDAHAVSLSQPTPLDLIRVAGLMVQPGGGVIADIHNDDRTGSAQTWNQPFSGAELNVQELQGPAAEGVLRLAAQDGWGSAKRAMRVEIGARYGNEISDAHEGDPNLGAKTWNLYLVTDEVGQVRWGYYADDSRLDGVPDLPTRSTDYPPDYFARLPTTTIDDALAGRPNPAFERLPHAAEFQFFLREVLKTGVPGHVRAAFEQEVAALPEGAINPAVRQSLSLRYPGVANAYSADQWARAFGSRGLEPF